MSDYQAVTNDTFILRVWREAASGTWRGQIVHLPGQEVAYVATLAQALAFMNRFVPGIAPPNADLAPGDDTGGRDAAHENDK